MKTVIKPVTGLKGDIAIPGDKSISHRAALLGAISRGDTLIKGYLEGEDTLHTIQGIENLGVEVKRYGRGEYLISGRGLDGLSEPPDVLNCGNAGTMMRLLTGLLAPQSFYSVLTGDSSLRKRPMERIIKPLTLMGAKIISRKGGYAPLSIEGRSLNGIEYTLPVPSAQLKSAILLAGLYAQEEVKIYEPIISRDHTERLLKYLGADIKINKGEIILKGNKALQAREINVPGDFSSAAFFITAGLIVPDSEIILRNVGLNSTRTGFMDVLKAMGADIEEFNKKEYGYEPIADLRIKYSELNGITIRGEIIPRLIDEIPILAVLATQARGDTVIRDAEELRVKETDRISALVTELQKLGVKVIEFKDGFKINGPAKLKGNVKLDSHGDHRMAMALSIAGLVASGAITITDSKVINISFPGFQELLSSLK